VITDKTIDIPGNLKLIKSINIVKLECFQVRLLFEAQEILSLRCQVLLKISVSEPQLLLLLKYFMWPFLGNVE